MDIRDLGFIVCMFIVPIASLLICHGEPIQAVPRVVVLDRPPPYIKVLSGSNVEFTWKFRVFEVKLMKAISWYYTFSADNWADHHKLVQKKFKANASSEVSGNPVLKRNRANCTFDFLNQIWTINCRLLNAKAYDSASYGMKVEFNGSPVINLNNTSSLNVIDLALDKKKSDHIVESWIGKPTVLKCAIRRNVILTTQYKWNVITELKYITRGIKRGANKTSYTFIPLSKKDFGKYRCTIETAATTVEHEILLTQIHYAGAPEQLRHDDITDSGRYVRLFWDQPRTNGGTSIISYEIIVTGGKRELRKNTTKLSAGVKLPDNSRYVIRVCSINKMGKTESSCTIPRDIGAAQLTQKGKQNRLKGHSLSILASVILVLWVILTI